MVTRGGKACLPTLFSRTFYSCVTLMAWSSNFLIFYIFLMIFHVLSGRFFIYFLDDFLSLIAPDLFFISVIIFLNRQPFGSQACAQSTELHQPRHISVIIFLPLLPFLPSYSFFLTYYSWFINVIPSSFLVSGSLMCSYRSFSTNT